MIKISRTDMLNRLINDEDGLILPDVGPWSKTKYKKISYYDQMFSMSMKNRWDCRVYMDLFSSAGKAIIRDNSEIVIGSPLLALNVDPPFDEYIFCEKSEENLLALKKRVSKHFPNHKCTYILGDCNDKVKDIIKAVPKFTKFYKGLTFCFIDPFKSAEINFSTIEQLAKNLYIDFLILIPSFMDINRNAHNYTRIDDISLDIFLGTNSWRTEWQKNRKKSSSKFGNFITLQFCERMKYLGFIYESENDLELVKMETGKNLPLYHLAFFSKNQLGINFWRETIRNTNEQLVFNWGSNGSNKN